MNHPKNVTVKWSYVLKLSSFTVLLIFIALVGLAVELGRQYVSHLTRWACPVPLHQPAEVGLANVQTVQIYPQPGQTLTAWYVPSQNGASILLLQGHWAARDGMLPDAQLLAQHGYGVMLLDPHPCTAPRTLHTMGYAEVADVDAAIQWLEQQPDVADGKIGILGFSIGGVIAVESAAQIPEIQAVIAAGNFHDLTINLVPRGANNTRVGSAVREIIIFWYRYYTGLDPNLVKPIESVAQISPRPLLLIAGEYEAGENFTQAQFAAAGSPKELWIVPGVDHGGYRLGWADEYEQRVIGFFDKYLIPKQ